MDFIFFFSLVKDWFPMGCKIKEEQEGHLFRKENFKESLFHVLCVKEREQKADTAIYSLSYSGFLVFFNHLLSWGSNLIQQN